VRSHPVTSSPHHLITRSLSFTTTRFLQLAPLGSMIHPPRYLRVQMLRYFSTLKPGRIALWCYLIWYLIVVTRHFDPTPRIWLNSLGISAVIGIALSLSVDAPTGTRRDRWQTLRLFMMPFCVSSFSALIKGQGFVLIFPPTSNELAILTSCCAAFVLLVSLIKHFTKA
jgi:hypothetical protein